MTVSTNQGGHRAVVESVNGRKHTTCLHDTRLSTDLISTRLQSAVNFLNGVLPATTTTPPCHTHHVTTCAHRHIAHHHRHRLCHHRHALVVHTPLQGWRLCCHVTINSHQMSRQQSVCHCSDKILKTVCFKKLIVHKTVDNTVTRHPIVQT